MGEDADLEVGDEDQDWGAGVVSADSDVVELAVVAEGDSSHLVDAVLADSEVVGGVEAGAGGGSFGSGVEGFLGGLSSQCPVGSLGVVVVGEPVELVLEFPGAGGGGLAAEPVLLGLVESFHFAAGLG